MKNKGIILLTLFALISVQFSFAQNFIGYGSSMELSSMGGNIGLSLEPKFPIEDTVLNLKGGDEFTIMARTLTGGTATDKVAVALVASNRALKEILAEKTLGVSGNTTVSFDCKISESTSVVEGDMIMLVSSYLNGMYQEITTSYGGVVTNIPAKNYQIPFCKINLPDNIPGVKITKGDATLYRDKIVRGRNYSFYVKPDNSNIKVIVEANGSPLVEQWGYYALNNVLGDIDITVRVFNPETAVTYRNLELSEDVRLTDLLTQDEMDCISYLKLTGYLAFDDFYTMRDKMPFLNIIDMTEAKTQNNYIPERAFEGRASITNIYLPESVEGFASNAFYGIGIESIVLPENLSVFGYNQFYGCSKLTTVWVKWDPTKHNMTSGFPIPPCAFRGTPYSYDGTLIVPAGCVNYFKNTENWGNFANIREEGPIDIFLTIPPAPPTQPTTCVKELGNELSLSVADGHLRIVNNSAEELVVKVYSMNGTLCCNKVVDTAAVVELPAGVYIVVADGVNEKVVIK